MFTFDLPYSQYRMGCKIRDTIQSLPHTTVANSSMALRPAPRANHLLPCHRRKLLASLTTNRLAGVFVRRLALRFLNLHEQLTHIVNWKQGRRIFLFSNRQRKAFSNPKERGKEKSAGNNAPVSYVKIWKHFQFDDLISHIEKGLGIHVWWFAFLFVYL